MRSFAFTLLVFAQTNLAYGLTWTATCNDQNKMEYSQELRGQGSVSMLVRLDEESTQKFPLAAFDYTSFNGVSICGKAQGDASKFNAKKEFELCINWYDEIIFFKYKTELQQSYDGENIVKYCSADIVVE